MKSTLALVLLSSLVLVTVTARRPGRLQLRLIGLTKQLEQTALALDECQSQLPSTTPETTGVTSEEPDDMRRREKLGIRAQIALMRGQLEEMKDALEECHDRLGISAPSGEEEEGGESK